MDMSLGTLGVLAADTCTVDDLIVWLAERQGMHD
jgi:hypothetical protein